MVYRFSSSAGRPTPRLVPIPTFGASSQLAANTADGCHFELAKSAVPDGIVVEAIKTAIITELRGYEIYKAAADRTTDPAAKLMFEKLAEDERYHKEFLEKNFQSVLENGEWAVPATPENLTPLDDSDIVDSDGFLRLLTDGLQPG